MLINGYTGLNVLFRILQIFRHYSLSVSSYKLLLFSSPFYNFAKVLASLVSSHHRALSNTYLQLSTFRNLTPLQQKNISSSNFLKNFQIIGYFHSPIFTHIPSPQAIFGQPYPFPFPKLIRKEVLKNEAK